MSAISAPSHAGHRGADALHLGVALMRASELVVEARSRDRVDLLVGLYAAVGYALGLPIAAGALLVAAAATGRNAV